MAQRSKLTRTWMALRRIFRPPFRGYLLENKYKVEAAFELSGVKYFQFASQEEAPTGRQMAALAIYNEMEMRCTRDYLELHCRAMDKLLGDPKQIHIGYIAQINENLKERLNLMVIPDFIYKLASVVFFDETESPYSYDYAYNDKKIEKWKKNGATLDFFLSTPLINLAPFLRTQRGVSSIYLKIAEQVAEIHHRQVTDILSQKELTTN